MIEINDEYSGCSSNSESDDASRDNQASIAGGCSCGSDCCDGQKNTKVKKRRITIDFLYLDLSVCTRC